MRFWAAVLTHRKGGIFGWPGRFWKVLKENKIKIDLAIVDFRVRRRKVFFKLSQLGFSKEIEYFRDGRILSIVKNKAGTLTPQLFKAIKLSLDKSLEDGKPKKSRRTPPKKTCSRGRSSRSCLP